MIIPMSWLRELTGIKDDIRAFMEKMTHTGVKVEGLTTPGSDISDVVVGRMTAIEKHPNADKLLITKVDIGGRELQIVTGALNLKAGDYVPVALDGACLAQGLKIKKGKLRGEVSDGMLCSINELGYTRHDYPEAPEDGIYVFPEPQELGADIKPIMDLCDEAVEFEIMSNRPDCNSVIGVAREACAAYGYKFDQSAGCSSKKNPYPNIKLKEEALGCTAEHIGVEIQSADLCPRYIGRVVTDVRIAPSPQWLRRRLTFSGVRPINNIVDITNYVMLEYGQPLHAFDITQVAQNKIVVRNARAGEKFTTLDGVERLLDDTMLVIADPEKALAIAGVMGGENSMVTEDVQTILFESANFNKVNIRLTSKKLGLRTDASGKFEKGLDPELAEIAVNRAMELIEMLGCGKVAPGMADAYPGCKGEQRQRKVAYDPARINALLGTDISASVMAETLNRIGIDTHERVGQRITQAEPPTFRGDITCEADIAEEIARFHGYNNIESVSVQHVAVNGSRSERRKREDSLSQALLGLGYNEAMTYPFESPRVFDKLRISADDPLRKAIPIQNPLGEDFSIMRTLTLGGLLHSLAVNYNRRNESARLFELAYTYNAESLPLKALPEERGVLTLAAYETAGGMGFFDIKGDVEQLLGTLGLKNLGFTAASPVYMHPGRTAAVSVNNTAVGYLGEVHPVVRENYQIGVRVYAAVLDMDTLHGLAAESRPAFTPLPKFPSVQRDLSFTLKAGVTAAEVEAAIRERGGPLLKEARLFDVYQGPQVEDGYKSMAYSLRFRAPDRTLSDEDIQKPLKTILDNLRRRTGAELRS